MKLFVPAAEISRALILLDGLRAKGIRLSGDDGSSRVTVRPTRLGVWELPPVALAVSRPRRSGFGRRGVVIAGGGGGASRMPRQRVGLPGRASGKLDARDPAAVVEQVFLQFLVPR